MGASEIFGSKDKIIESKIMEHRNSVIYRQNIQGRSFLHFMKGIVPRYLQWCKHKKARQIARIRGAIIGENVILPLSLAKRANKNLIVGHNTSIQTDKIDLRSPVKIGNYCIIGICEIITTSHQVDSPEWEQKNYGIEIDDYTWVATNVLITPSCRHIGYGAVAGAGSVVVKDIDKMSIVGGNPAVHLRYRKQAHDCLVVESLLGGDLRAYIKAWKNKKNNR
jgi:acetyltransferase-like isoleucine patch superfamily enzyme